MIEHLMEAFNKDLLYLKIEEYEILSNEYVIKFD